MSDIPQINTIRAADPSVQEKARARRFKYINIPLVIVTFLLVSYGLLIVYSAIQDNSDYSFTRQLQFVLIGAVIMVVMWRFFDYRLLSEYSLILLIINVVLILSPHIPFLGKEVMGGNSFIVIFGQQLQPGEFAKITMILMAASLVSQYGGRLDDLRTYLKTLGILLIPFLCVMTQPDLGTGLVYLFIAAVALVVGGARPRYLLLTLAAAVVAFIALLLVDEVLKSTTGSYALLKDYQRSRLMVFFDDSYATSDEGYQLAQAKIAIGSGGLFGKGYMNATQSTLGFLPEAPTDFIFCVLAEQLGFFGVLILLGLYSALILICFRIATRSSDLFGMLSVMCVVGMWLFQILENIGMTCGLMPITGIPLQFMSYGSSYMLANFILLGLVGSVWARSS